MSTKFTISKQARLANWWQPKAGNILLFIYLAFQLCYTKVDAAIFYLIPALVTILGIGAFGHFINDWSDIKDDLAVRKKNSFADKTLSKRFLYVAISMLLAFVPWLILPFDKLSLLLLSAEFVLLFIYAVPPFKLKTRGLWGIFTDALYAYAMPSLLAFHTFVLLFAATTIPLYFYVIIGIWQFFVGIFNMLIHQMEDYQNDLQTKTKTWVTQIGKIRARKWLIQFFLPTQFSMFCLFLVYVYILTSWQGLIFTLGSIAWVLFKYIGVFKSKNLNTFIISKNPSDLQLLNIHYHHFLPYLMLLCLTIADFRFLLLFFGHLLLFRLAFLKFAFQNTLGRFLKLLDNLLRKTVNYSIYYFRRTFLFQSKEKAMREHYAAYLETQKELAIKNELPNIIIANQNKAKYTETFVKKHIEELPYHAHQLYGGNLPFIDTRQGNLLGHNKTKFAFISWINKLRGIRNEEYKKQQLINFILKNNIELILAEFGPCGAALTPICEKLNIPLITIFHGYDAWHKEVLEKHKEDYKKLFDYASQIVCVSKEILLQLESLGAKKQKLVYLPCSINQELFTYTNHILNKNIFLAIGRFAETKSPHLTILAFNEVLKEIPDAELRMIGKDGGGELFEACHILVKALKIEGKVHFLGIKSPHEVKEEMDKARVFVQHSLTTPINGDKEGTPVSVMEAMANGLPIIATRHAGIAEMIVHNENGILIEEYDYLQMAKEMVRVCKNDSLVESLGKMASESILNNDLLINNTRILADIIDKHRLK